MTEPIVQTQEEKHNELDIEAGLEWETIESVCPICGNAMVLVNGFHRCRSCGYKESCCYL